MLVQMKTSRFDARFSYALPDGVRAAIGDIVRVQLGSRSQFGFVVSDPRTQAADKRLKRLTHCGLERAFDQLTLELAEWLAEYYVCSLGEALSTIVPASNVPRVVERILPIDRDAATGRAGVPERLTALLFDEFAHGVAIEELLRHPEARRSADRPALRRALRVLIEHLAVARERSEVSATVGVRRVRRLLPGAVTPKGKKSAALHALVSEAGVLLSSEAVLAGYSRAMITAAVRGGALIEEEVAMEARRRTRAQPRPAVFAATTEQRDALATLNELLERGGHHDVVLHGVTGSGKTFVYLEYIRSIVARNESAIVLVPEISLTPQTARRFEAIFGDDVVVLHSALSERERFEGRRAAERGEVRVVVGARSAVFTSVPNLRAIIVDEAHETSYKQDNAPRYHAVTVARERMRRAGGMLILGSATPPLEEYALARLGRATPIVLRERTTGAALPRTTVVDLTKEPAGSRDRAFSTLLVERLERTIARGEKAVLFVNRRGTSSFVLCRVCGFVPTCERCSLSLTYHRAEERLRCHLCDAQAPMHEACPRCTAAPFKPYGIGTQRVADELLDLFPSARVVRMDSDTTTRVGDHARLLDRFESEGDVLVGTQMIAKGLDFPQVTLAAVISADIGLHIADFRASERTFDLLTQVAGRSGRASLGDAVIQTYLPDHPARRVRG